ncbi:MAG: hypothetical protein IKE66_06060 [Hyphomicrobium sp.]|nr:hypothetical protein [Hyphomicrobium sp.]
MDYFHLSGVPLAVGSIIEPGNYGRIVRAMGWRHSFAYREMALESARLTRFAHLPSRLDAAFVLLTLEEMREFQRLNSANFQNHIQYRVTLCDEKAASNVTDSRLCNPAGSLRADWADVYWLDIKAQSTAIPGVDWATAAVPAQLREMLTLSQLRIEERLDA